MPEFTTTERTEVRRLPKRGVYSREEIYAILDEGFVCHVGFVANAQPYVIPTNYARRGDELLIHGSSASRMLRTLEGGVDVCVTVTLVDGMVLARSAFHHSVNYRSVVALGKAQPILDPAEKMDALWHLTDAIVPGRWAEVRPPTEQELKGTAVLRLPLTEVSGKIRRGGPVDDEEDLALPVWAGVVPLKTVPGTPVASEDLAAGVAPVEPARFQRGQGNP
jgi:nitroimidazol reductase NimA-like FMN-containing flavoprotein (pyridoxamine 5'-phosphate oxidase superfamily)